MGRCEQKKTWEGAHACPTLLGSAAWPPGRGEALRRLEQTPLAVVYLEQGEWGRRGQELGRVLSAPTRSEVTAGS